MPSRPGRRTYVKYNFMHAMNDEAIEIIADFAGKSPSGYSFAPILEHWHGAVARVGVSDTAFPHRHHSYNFIIWSNWENAADSDKNSPDGKKSQVYVPIRGNAGQTTTTKTCSSKGSNDTNGCIAVFDAP